MTDATTEGLPLAHEADSSRHDHARSSGAHAHTHATAPDCLKTVQAATALETSAGARLISISLVVAALWAGVYWALH